MNKFLLTAFSLILALGFCGCDKKDSPDKKPDNPAVMNVDDVVSLMTRYRHGELTEAQLADLLEDCFYVELPDDYDLIPDALPAWDEVKDDPLFVGGFSDAFLAAMDRLHGVDPLACETYEEYRAACRSIVDASGLSQTSDEYYALDAALTYGFEFLDDTLESEYRDSRSWSSFWRSVGRCTGNILSGALTGFLTSIVSASHGEFLVTGALGAIGGALEGLVDCF